ncbi:hypothetical protein [Nocardia pseudovaccinii]|uniref:hypothetical protein n=1 Tax=Nocardia pseudovaccinii TaxID=189540 RepID=UPI0007A5270E|nr:hypothetical protein [Nocardia pseudovaccinii]
MPKLLAREAFIADQIAFSWQHRMVTGAPDQLDRNPAFADLGVCQAPSHRHTVRGSDQIQLHPPNKVIRSSKTRHTPPMMRSGNAIALGRNENK